MEAIEPVLFTVDGTGLDVDQAGPQAGEWDETKRHLLDSAVSDFCDPLNDEMLIEKYREVFKSEIEPIEEVLPNFERISQIPTGFPFTLPGTVYLHDESFIITNIHEDGIFYIISNNKNKARNLRDKSIDALIEKTSVVKGAGIEDFNIVSGSDFAKAQLESIGSVDSIHFGELDEFEETIFETVSPISESFVHNVTIDFQEVPQNREYDMLFLTTSENILHIAVKDYSGIDKTPTADDLINNPRNQAILIGADMTYSIVKGVDDLSPFLKEAELRDDVKICEKQDCHDNIRKFIQDDMIKNSFFSSQTGGFTLTFG